MLAAKFEVYQDPAGKIRWHLKADDGEVIASSGEQCYSTKVAAEKAIRSIQTIAAYAAIVDLTPTEQQRKQRIRKNVARLKGLSRAAKRR